MSEAGIETTETEGKGNEEENRKPQRQGNRKNSGFRIRVKERRNWWGGEWKIQKIPEMGKSLTRLAIR